MPETAAVDRMTIALEELTEAICNTKEQIPFTDKSINKAIEALTKILSQNRPSATKKTVSVPRESASRKDTRVARVNNSQRVLRPRVAMKHQVYSRGTRTYKSFNNKYHRGYICDFDSKEGYYKVRYEDGDVADYDEDEIKSMLHKPNNNNIREAMASTRFERVQAAYAKTKSEYSKPSMYSAGYARGIEIIEMGLTETPYQGYKYASVVIDEETGKAMEYRDLLKDERHSDTWAKAGANEYGRLFQGCGKKKDGKQRIKGTNTCHWIPRSKVPRGKKVTYARTVVYIRPEIDEPNRVRITAGGDRLEYYGETSTETASIETAKILLNSVLSTKNAKFMSINI